MKKYIVIAALFMVVIPFTVKAQQQGALSRFIVGTDPLNLTTESTKSQTQYTDGSAIPVTNANSTNTESISAHVNLFVGYFITKNICTGLQFGKNTVLSPFIRYYPFRKNPDSSKVEFFLQANFTFNSTNTNYPYHDDTAYNGSTATAAYSVSTTIFDFSIGAAVAWNFNRHWALEGEIGYVYGNSITKTGAYTTISTQFDPTRGIWSNNYSTSPETKNTSLSNEGALRLMLSYRL